MTPLHGIHQWAAAARLTQPDFDPAVDAVDVDAAPLGAGGTNEGFGDLFLDPDDNPDGTQDIGPGATYAQVVVMGADGLGYATPPPGARPVPVWLGPRWAGRTLEMMGAAPGAGGTPAGKAPLRAVVAAQIAAQGGVDPTTIVLFDGAIVILLFHSADRVRLDHPKHSALKFSYATSNHPEFFKLDHGDSVNEGQLAGLSFRVDSSNGITRIVEFVHTQDRWAVAVPAAKAAPVPPAAENRGTLWEPTWCTERRIRDLVEPSVGPLADHLAGPLAEASDTREVESRPLPRPAAPNPIAGLIEDVRRQMAGQRCGGEAFVSLPALAIGIILYGDRRYRLRIDALPPGVRLERLLHEDEGKVVSIPSHTYSIDCLPASGLLTLFVTHDGTRVRLEFEKLPNGDWRLEDRFTG